MIDRYTNTCVWLIDIQILAYDWYTNTCVWLIDIQILAYGW